MPSPRDVLTPDALAMLQTVAATGSFAAAARTLDLVPSALSYRVRQIEDALDVLLFDRSARQARLTEAGAELLREADRLLDEIDAVANRVKRVATGWEPMLTIAVDSVIARDPLLDLATAFFALEPPTRLKLRDETLLGTIEALTSGEADLAIGAVLDAASLAFTATGIRSRLIGELRFVYAVAPHHPLARLPQPLSDAAMREHRAVAAADSTRHGTPMTVNLIGGQDVLTVPSMQAKIAAQLHGLGGGFLPEPMARPYIEAGHLVELKTERRPPLGSLHCAWRAGKPGRALEWWLAQFEHEGTRRALLERHRGR
ncbi:MULTISPECIES: LysR substrate-binding domain-containing protein [Variovorax]|jgi:DNA-binding transcriptional LysR family regulator|uniref:LysR substrate-binding domain-containing protein n=1 Tax=Variovorax TaxID=34072 RepID=UPI00086DD841|nr:MULTISPECIES: LysR substrate-binding domain-containing protein [Variovorax]MBN8752387.1 LysR family transcriptional regulator [Variovorax sp.]ODU18142.1 MAG: LysR family transcriptional regulator [Variovorax sp. SCN 67-85]ODV26740.1 MAG: LysR family transcriptional regulator [Variovorax sp. SCN 67-20]OJZ08829.1 MAG: LysR family transcriptional regulator [Variovorax sp. 67-131]UKI11288.1 LysR substrate-binding domain-containing protein [Variovorax paradoxus]